MFITELFTEAEETQKICLADLSHLPRKFIGVVQRLAKFHRVNIGFDADTHTWYADDAAGLNPFMKDVKHITSAAGMGAAMHEDNGDERKLVAIFRKEKPHHAKIYLWKTGPDDNTYEMEVGQDKKRIPVTLSFAQIRQTLAKKGFNESITRAGRMLIEAHINQQLSLYKPDGKTYRQKPMPDYDENDIFSKSEPVAWDDDAEETVRNRRADFDHDENEALKRVSAEQLAKLDPRYSKLLRMRFWDDMTLEQCGAALGVGTARARQIEAKALRQLRQTSIRDKEHPLNQFRPNVTEASMTKSVPSKKEGVFNKGVEKSLGQQVAVIVLDHPDSVAYGKFVRIGETGLCHIKLNGGKLPSNWASGDMIAVRPSEVYSTWDPRIAGKEAVHREYDDVGGKTVREDTKWAKLPSGDYRNMDTGRAYAKKGDGPDNGGNSSYMTPEYMLDQYKKRLAAIAASPYKRPKEVAQLQKKIAKLSGQRSYMLHRDGTETPVSEGLQPAVLKLPDGTTQKGFWQVDNTDGNKFIKDKKNAYKNGIGYYTHHLEKNGSKVYIGDTVVAGAAQDKTDTDNGRNYNGTVGNNRWNEGAVQEDDDRHTRATVYPNGIVVKNKKGREVGEVYPAEGAFSDSSGIGWGYLHYASDYGAFGLNTTQDAYEELVDTHNEYVSNRVGAKRKPTPVRSMKD